MDELISKRAAIDAIWEHATRILENSDYDVFFQDIYKMAHRHIAELIASMPSAQPERLTDDDFETIRIHLNAYKEKLCNQQRWKEAEEYQRIIDRFMAFASAQPDLSGYSDKLWKAAYERGKAEAEQRGILWEKLERYAEFFCADVPYTEFVREAKQFFLDAERSEE